MMNNHTPGPWKAVHRHIHGTSTSDELDGLGWEIEGPPEPIRGQFAKAADAHLIAAAPELLAACRALISYRDRVGAMNFQLEKADDFINQMRAIATGQGEP